MFYIKSDDIEELFREAAEKYHIDTAGAQAWDDVQAAVHADDAPTPPPVEKPRRRWFALGWLLLVPLGWFAHNFWTALNEPKAKPITGQVVKTGQTGQTGKANVNNNNNLTDTDDNKKPAVATTLADLQKKINEKPPLAGTKGIFAAKNANASMRIRQADIAGNDIDTRPGSNPRPGKPNYNNQDGAITAGDKHNTQQTTGSVSDDISLKAGEGVIDKGLSNDIAKTNPPAIIALGNQPNSSQAAQANGTGKQDKKPAKARPTHYFYAGLSLAPDLSFIHFQQTSAMGAGAGVLLGYRLNNNFSVESGALLERKYYYTSGEYFDISKIPYFVNNNIHPESATGNCNMVEIPLNLRYTFTTKGKNGFYAIGGISSYLMGHQAYTFDYDEWGQQRQSTWGYNNPAGYWFSILNLGAGYARTLGTKTNIRIEPYIKLPLSGLGTGDLKIASTGLYLTLTRKIP